MVVNFNEVAEFNGPANGGQTLQNPTSLQFGPDGRLYVAQQSGEVGSFQIDFVNGSPVASDYQELVTVTTEGNLPAIRSIRNHDDFGIGEGTVSDNSTNFNDRQVTGIVVTEDPATGATIVYVTSSDPRIASNGERNLDTNSGVLTKLTQVLDDQGNPVIENGEAVYDAVELIRGLPRSEENHSTNGMALTEEGTLLMQVGGFTNNGAPSPFFSFTAEYALSAAVLEIDLAALEQMDVKIDADAGIEPDDGAILARQYVYDLPTLDDPNRINAPANLSDEEAAAQGYFENSQGLDLQGPFGGNDGFNQAVLPADAPLSIYADGFRNAYDVAIRSDGVVATIDNGSNGQSVQNGLGGNPILDDEGFATNDPNNGGPGDPEPLYRIDEGFYHGHPNPTRSNQDGSLAIRNNSGNVDDGANPNVFGYEATRAGLNVLGVDKNETDDMSSLVPDALDIEDGFLIDPSKFTDDPTRLQQSGLRLDRNAPDLSNLLTDPETGEELGRLPILTVGTSTNGVTFYETDGLAFGGAIDGALISTSFNGNITLYNLNAAGDGLDPIIVDDVVQDQDGQIVLENLGGTPLDVTQGPNGTLWIARIGANDITVLQPSDIVLPDDPDFDDDGINDEDDPFSRDDANGRSVVLTSGKTLVFDFDPDQDGNLPGPNGISAGLTGVAINGVVNYEQFFRTEFTGFPDENGLPIGPDPDLPAGEETPGTGEFAFDNVKFITAALGGTTTIEEVSDGTMKGTANNGLYQFQTGVTVSPSVNLITATWTIGNPGTTLVDPAQEVGGFFGDGTQSNFVSAVIRQDPDSSDPTDAELLIEIEENDVVIGSTAIKIDGFLGVDAVPDRLFQIELAIDTDAETVTPTVRYVLDASGNVISGTGNVFTEVGQPIDISGATSTLAALNGQNQVDGDPAGAAFGLFSSNGPIDSGNAPFSAVFADLEIAGEGDVEPTAIYRVNVNGPQIAATDGGIPWSADSVSGQDSPFLVEGGASSDSTAGNVNNFTLLPPSVPTALFSTARFDPGASPEMSWAFPVTAGLEYEVRLYHANGFGGASEVGERVYDVALEGEVTGAFDDIDPVALFGNLTAGVTSNTVVAQDDTLNIEFLHGVENPNLFAIEIIEFQPSSDLINVAIVGSDAIIDENIAGGLLQIGVNAAETVPAGQVVSVDFTVGGGTAIAGEDFTIDPSFATLNADLNVYEGSVTIPGGSSDQQIPIDIVDDALDASDATEAVAETLTVTLTGASGNAAVTAPSSVEITILDDDTETPPGTVVVAVNAGGSNVTQDGIDFVANTGANGGADGSVIGQTGAFGFVGGTAFADNGNDGNGAQTDFDGTVWETERFGASLNFEAELEAGEYTIELYFAEIFLPSAQNPGEPAGTGLGARVFDIVVEGETIFDNFDILANVGEVDGVPDINEGLSFVLPGAYSPSADGVLDIDFLAEADNAKVSAIVIRTADDGPSAPQITIGAPVPPAQPEQGDDGVTTLSFPVTVSPTPAGPVTVEYAVDINGEAVGGLTQELTFSGDAITVEVPNDAADNGPETVTVTLTGLTVGGDIAEIGATSSAVGTVNEDDGVDPLNVDGDATPNTADPFAFDPANGLGRDLAQLGEIVQNFDTPTDDPFSAAGGFSGILVNPAFAEPGASAADPYGDRTVEDNVSIDNGALSITSSNEDAFGGVGVTDATNTIRDVYQSGVDVTGADTFEIVARAANPFVGQNPIAGNGFKQFGVSFGAGGVDDFVKLIISDQNGNNGVPRVQIASQNSLLNAEGDPANFEVNANFDTAATGDPDTDGQLVGVVFSEIADFEFRAAIDKSADTVPATLDTTVTFFDANGVQIGQIDMPQQQIDPAGSLQAALDGANPLTGGAGGLAYGVFLTDWNNANGATGEFTAEYDFIRITDTTEADAPDQTPPVLSVDAVTAPTDAQSPFVIDISFDEPVVAGPNFDAIALTDSFGEAYSFDFTPTVGGLDNGLTSGTLTAQPPIDGFPNADYGVAIPAGAFQDLSANPSAGVGFAETLALPLDPNEIYDENVNGDLSGNNLAPTALPALGLGSNIVSLSATDANADDPDAGADSGDRDYFTVVVPEGFEISGLFATDYEAGGLSNNLAFLALSDEPTVNFSIDELVDGAEPPTSNLIGGALFGDNQVASNTNLLELLGGAGRQAGEGFDGPLGTGTYTFWYQQNLDTSRASLDFVLAEVVDLPPVFAADTPTELSIDENVDAVLATFSATDPEGLEVVYSLSGDDAEDFVIDETSGALAFDGARDFEDPQDADTDNVYNVTVVATAGDSATEAAVAVTVNDQPDAIPVVPGDVIAAFNAGGGPVTQDGVDFAAATSGTAGPFFNGAAFTDAPNSGNGEQAVFDGTVYETEINGNSGASQPDGANFQFAFETGPGQVFVDLYFAEIFASTSGAREFDVIIEGVPFLQNFDIVGLTGDDDIPVIASTTAPVTVSEDGILNIDFVADVDRPKVSGVVIREAVIDLPFLNVAAPTPPTVEQGDDGVTTVAFPVSFSETPDGPVTIAYTSVVDGVSTPGQTLTVAPEGGVIPVDVPNDALLNGAEQVSVEITEIVSGATNAQIGQATAAAEVLEDDAFPNRFVVAAINAGGPALNQDGIDFTGDGNPAQFTTPAGGVFADGVNFDVNAGNGVQPAFDGTVFETERNTSPAGVDQLTYALDVGAGDYTVELYFAEIFLGAPGGRVFDVAVNGETVLDDFDVLVETGGDINQSVVIEIPNIFTVAEGETLDITLIDGIENAKISGIVARQVDETAPTATLTLTAPATLDGAFALAIQFDEPVVGPIALADVTLSGATLGQIAATEATLAPDGLSATASFAAPAGGFAQESFTASIAAAAATDRAGNALVAADSPAVGLDVDDAPAFTGAPTAGQIFENATGEVASFAAEDPDGEAVTFSLGAGAENFAIDAQSGALSLTAAQNFEDFEGDPTLAVEVIATSGPAGAEQSVSTDFTLTIQDVEEDVTSGDDLVEVSEGAVAVDLNGEAPSDVGGDDTVAGAGEALDGLIIFGAEEGDAVALDNSSNGGQRASIVRLESDPTALLLDTDGDFATVETTINFVGGAFDGPGQNFGPNAFQSTYDAATGVTTFVFAPSAPPPSVRIQAEAFDDLGGFSVQNPSAADGGVIFIPGGLTGQPQTAALTITPQLGITPGVNDVAITFFDENDGVSTLTLSVLKAGESTPTQIDTITFDEGVLNAAQAENLRSATIAGVELAIGDQLLLTGVRDDGELVRVDYIEITSDQPAPNEQPEVIGAIADVSLTQDAPFSLDLEGVAPVFSDADEETLTYTILGDDLGLFEINGSVLSAQPTNADVIAFQTGDTLGEPLTVTIVAIDPSNATAQTTFQLVGVANVNDAPQLANGPLADFAVAVGDPLPTIDLGAAFVDPDAPLGDAIAAIEVEGLPAGVSFDPQTGLITGAPTAAGPNDVTVTVTDANDAELVETFTIDVTGGFGPQTVRIEAEDFDLNSGFFGTAPLFFEQDNVGAASEGSVIALPSNAVGVASAAIGDLIGESGLGSNTLTVAFFDENDGESSLELAILRAGADAAETIETFVFDQSGGGNAAQAVNLRIETVPNVVIGAGDLLLLIGARDAGEFVRVDYVEATSSGGDAGNNRPELIPNFEADGVLDLARAGEQDLNQAFFDLDEDPLTFGVTDQNGQVLPYLSIVGDALVVGVDAPLGATEIRLSATDIGGSGLTTTRDLTLNVLPQVFDQPTAIGSVEPAAATEEAAFSLSLPAEIFAGVSEQTFFFATQPNGDALPAWLEFTVEEDGSFTFSGTPDDPDVGDLEVVILASENGDTAIQTFTLSVARVDDAPVVDQAQATPLQAAVGQPLNLALPAGLITDPDLLEPGSPEDLSFSGEGLPAGVFVNADTGALFGVPEATGTSTITVTATDQTGASVEAEVTLTVSGALAGEPRRVQLEDPTEAVLDNYQVENNTSYDGDAGIRLPNNPSGTGSATVDLAALELAPGTYNLVLGYIDETDGVGSIVATLNGDALDTITLDDPNGGNFLQPQNFLTRTLGQVVIDGSPQELVLTGFAGTNPSPNQNNFTEFARMDWLELVPQLLSDNNPPVVEGFILDQTAFEGATFTLALPEGLFVDSDPGDVLTLSLSDDTELPDGVTFDPTTGTFFGAPTEGQVGDDGTPIPFDVTVIATDLANAVAETSFVITLEEAATDLPPTVATPLADQIAVEDVPVDFEVPADTFAEIDGDPLTLTAQLAGGAALPDWLVFAPGAENVPASFSGTLTQADLDALGEVDALSIEVVATDKDGSATAGFTLGLTAVDDAPILNADLGGFDPVATAPGAEEIRIPLDGRFIDEEGQPLSFSLLAVENGQPNPNLVLPDWVFVDETTNEIVLAPPAELPITVVDTFDVAIFANDGANDSAPALLSVTLSPATAPTDGEALFTANLNGSDVIGDSTFSNNSMVVTNTSLNGVFIEQIVIDLTDTAIPDTAFDARSAAEGGPIGDATNKPFTFNSGSGLTAGDLTISFGGEVQSPINGGFGDNQLIIDFDPGSFAAGDSFGFSIDIDPFTATVGAIGGAVAGQELFGGVVTATFSDGSVATGPIVPQGGSTGGLAVAKAGETATKPSLTLGDGTTAPRVVNQADLPIVIDAGVENAGQTARIFILDTAFVSNAASDSINPPGGPDAIQGNNAQADATVFEVTLDADGVFEGTIPLTRSTTQEGAANGNLGFNYFAAGVVDAEGDVTAISDPLVVEFDPAANVPPIGEPVDPSAFEPGGDFDGDGVINSLDGDDDDDGISDLADAFQFDGENGVLLGDGESLLLTFDQPGNAFANGFTGFLQATANGGLFNEDTGAVTVANGLLTVDPVTNGDTGSSNNAQDDNQNGVKNSVFTVKTRGLNPLVTGDNADGDPSNDYAANSFDQFGAHVGLDTTNFLKLVVQPSGSGVVEFSIRVNDVETKATGGNQALPDGVTPTSFTSYDIEIVVDGADPANATADGFITFNDASGNPLPNGDRVSFGTINITGALATALADETVGVGAGLTHANGSSADPNFSVQYDSFEVIGGPSNGGGTPPGPNPTTEAEQILAALDDVDADGGYSSGATGAAVLTILDGGDDIEGSNFGNTSFQLTNTGDKQIAAVVIDFRTALLGDAVIDPDGAGGDNIAQDFTIGSQGGTGGFFGPDQYLFPGANPLPNTTGTGQASNGGFKGLLLKFSGGQGGFANGETIGFGGDMDPNSIAGLLKSGGNGVDSGALLGWDVGGIGGAELIGSTFTVMYDDLTFSSGVLGSDLSENGSIGETVQDRAIAVPTLSVAAGGQVLGDGESGTYDETDPVVTVSGTPGQQVRVTLVKGFNPVENTSNGIAALVQDRLDDAQPDFPVNNLFDIQNVDVTIPGSGSITLGANDFDYQDTETDESFAGDDQQPIAFVASVLSPVTDNDPDVLQGDELVPTGAVSAPITLLPDFPDDPTTPPGDGNPFLADDGLVIFEAESGEGIEDTDWEFLTVQSGSFQNSGYLQYEGPNLFGAGASGNNGPVSFDFIPDQTGEWFFGGRFSRLGEAPVNTEENDFWLRLLDSDGDFIVPNSQNGQAPTVTGDGNGPLVANSNDGYFKYYLGTNPNQWGVGGKNVDGGADAAGNPIDIAWNLDAGETYTLQFSGRSAGFQVDRLGLEAGNLPNAELNSEPESDRQDGSTPPPPPPPPGGQADFVATAGPGSDVEITPTGTVQSVNSPDLETDKTVVVEFDIPDGVSGVTEVDSALISFQSERGQSGNSVLTFAFKDTYADVGFGAGLDDLTSSESVTISEGWADNEQIENVIDVADPLNELLAANGPLDGQDTVSLVITGSGATRFIVQGTVELAFDLADDLLSARPPGAIPRRPGPAASRAGLCRGRRAFSLVPRLGEHPVEALGHPFRADRVPAVVQAQLERRARAAAPALADQPAARDGPVRLGRASVLARQQRDAVRDRGRAVDPHRVESDDPVAGSMDVPQRDRPARARLGRRAPEPAGDRRIGREQAAFVTSEVPDHRGAAREARSERPALIDRPAPAEIRHQRARVGRFVAAALGPPVADLPPIAELGEGRDEQRASGVHGRDHRAVAEGSFRRGVPAMVVHDHRQRRLAVPVGRRRGQVIAAIDLAAPGGPAGLGRGGRQARHEPSDQRRPKARVATADPHDRPLPAFRSTDVLSTNVLEKPAGRAGANHVLGAEPAARRSRPRDPVAPRQERSRHAAGAASASTSATAASAASGDRPYSVATFEKLAGVVKSRK